MPHIDGSLNPAERALLVSLSKSDGFPILQTIMESEVQKFNTALLNVKTSDNHEIVAAHTLAKAAAQFYQGVVDRLNHEIELHSNGQAGPAEVEPLEELMA